MDQKYDTIILGTGLKECILSGLLSQAGKGILHIDRNNYYGGESASLNLDQLYAKFKPDAKETPPQFGRSRDWNVDLCPKFIMSCGHLVTMLLKTKVTRYLEFNGIAGSYVYKGARVHKVPATASEALNSSLMGMFQKRRFRNYLNYVQAYDPDDAKTHQGHDLKTMTNRELFNHFSCDDNTQAFTGHAMALYLDDSYLDQPAFECVDKVKLYAYSVARYGKSPYIYPVWGLGGLPEGFARLCAIHGGTFMLNKPVDEILYDATTGRVTGIRSGTEVAYCSQLLADPSYFIGTDKVRKNGQVARVICILDHPIPDTGDADSAQIIIPARQVPGRNSDIYISCVSFKHNIAATNYWVACISWKVETANPKTEANPALALLGPRAADFYWVTDLYEPTGDGKVDGCYITKSYDATSHFETATEEVVALYTAMTGQTLDFSQMPDYTAEDDGTSPVAAAPTAAAAGPASAAAASS